MRFPVLGILGQGSQSALQFRREFEIKLCGRREEIQDQLAIDREIYPPPHKKAIPWTGKKCPFVETPYLVVEVVMTNVIDLKPRNTVTAKHRHIYSVSGVSCTWVHGFHSCHFCLWDCG